MGMPVTIEISDTHDADDVHVVLDYFSHIDDVFSTYKTESEMSEINAGTRRRSDASLEMREVLELSEYTKKETGGYFDIARPDGTIDPSGLVKGWAIHTAAQILHDRGMRNFFIDIGGDVEARGVNEKGGPWKVGIRDPFSESVRIIKVLNLSERGIATSGSYLRGEHIYNPHMPHEAITDIVSLSVVGRNVYEADRFATSAFAMGKEGILFIEQLDGFEAYSIDRNGIATMTSGFDEYTDTYAEIH